jgi:hypothetical protein
MVDGQQIIYRSLTGLTSFSFAAVQFKQIEMPEFSAHFPLGFLFYFILFYFSYETWYHEK